MSENTASNASTDDSSSGDSAPFNQTKGLIQNKFPGANDDVLNISTHEVLNYLQNNQNVSTEEVIASLRHIEFFNKWDMAAIMGDVASKKLSEEVEQSPSMTKGSGQVQTANQADSPDNMLSVFDEIDNAKSQDFNQKLSVENSLSAEETSNEQSAIVNERSRVQSAIQRNNSPFSRAPTNQRAR